ncbi:hypothetical protein [Rummeliibacillus suwonensis]|uniref:hypothetical protein n=1 Tax=Rummeliibacillus suwonensis TaxID=1306154 RepID=UPI0028A25507|nr:hypothetical protein [Rummeliibacillus suwonensis]
MNRKDFFFCYNRKMVDELIAEGFTYITRAKNLVTNAPFTLFYLDDKLEKYLRDRVNN